LNESTEAMTRRCASANAPVAIRRGMNMYSVSHAYRDW
jgi:hypothetical protein